MTSLSLNYPRKILSPNTVSLGFEASTYGLGEDIIQSLAGRYLADETQDTCWELNTKNFMKLERLNIARNPQI